MLAKEPPAKKWKVPGILWPRFHWTGFDEKRIKITNGRIVKLKLMDILEEQGFKPIIGINRDMRSGEDLGGGEHVNYSWYYYREKVIPKEKKQSTPGNILQRALGTKNNA
jgi:hypothetical protein